MRVEVFYLAGCPHHPPTVRRITEVLRQEGFTAELAEIEVNDTNAARAYGFLGSPTVRVDGQDIEQSARSTPTVGFTCRIYNAGGTRTGIPPADWIRAALREAHRGTGG
jgi:hypothetical protein